MEFRDLIKTISKHIWLFLIIVIAMIIGTYFYTINKSSTFVGSLNIYTMVSPQSDSSNFYEYDNYYTFQASESLLQTVAAWFKDPAYIMKIYSMANENLPDIKYKKYATLFSSKANIPSSLTISISSPSEQYVRNILEAAKVFSVQNVAEWQNKGLVKNISVMPSEIFIVNEKPSMSLNLVLGAVAGIVLALITIFGIEYFKTK